MGIRTVRSWIEVQPTQMRSDADWVGLSMIRNAHRLVSEPTQTRSYADRVGLSMTRNALREAGVPTQTCSDADWVGSQW